MISRDRAEFDRCWPWLLSALECGLGGASTFHKEDIWNLVDRGAAQFFAFERSAGLTVPTGEPRNPTLQIWIAGGKLKSVVDDVVKSAEVYARDHNYARVAFGGRTTWGRVLNKAGYSATHTVFAKELL